MNPESALEPQVVLLVDEDVRTARRMASMLREDGLEVEVARDGAAAIARLARAPVPVALVTELTMPHADGFAVARFACAQRPGLPIFVVTGHPELVDAARFGGPLVVFTKPVDYLALQAALERAIGARAAAPQAAREIAEGVARAGLESETSDGRGDALSGTEKVRALR